MKWCEFCEAPYPDHMKQCEICERKLVKLDNRMKELIDKEIRKIV